VLTEAPRGEFAYNHPLAYTEARLMDVGTTMGLGKWVEDVTAYLVMLCSIYLAIMF
jgi:hypothetical protein